MKGVISATEWEFVVEPNTGHDYPERGGSFQEDHPGWCREPLELCFQGQAAVHECRAQEGEAG